MMKKRKIITSLTFLLICFVACCQQKLNQTEVISEFYTEYLKEVSNMPINVNRLDSLKKTICTVKLYNDFKDLDYDPFLNSQDVDDEILNTLSVEQDKIDGSRILVTYVDSYTKEQKKIIINTIIIGNKLKINSIAYRP